MNNTSKTAKELVEEVKKLITATYTLSYLRIGIDSRYFQK